MNQGYRVCPECFGLVPRHQRVCHHCNTEAWPELPRFSKLTARVLHVLLSVLFILLLLWAGRLLYFLFLR